MSDQYFANNAVDLHANGYDVLPVQAGAKRPLLSDWSNTVLDGETLQRFAENGKAGCSVGIKTGAVCALDLDIRDKRVANDMVQFIYELVGEAPLRAGERPKGAILYRAPDPSRRKLLSASFEDYLGQINRIEVLGAGQQVVSHGMHPSGAEYQWLNRSPNDTPVGQLPVLTDEHIAEIFRHFEELGNAVTEWSPHGSAKDSPGQGETKQPRGEDLRTVREALRHIDPGPYDDWIAVGMAMHHEFSGDADAYELWDSWSSLAHNYNDSNETWHKWQGFKDDRSTTIGTLYHLASTQGWTNTATADDFPDLTQQTPPTTQTKQNQPVTEEAPPSGLHIKPVSDWQGTTPPARDWLIEGLIPMGEVTGLYGDGGVGKSLLALEMQTCIALGVPFYGHKVKQFPVLGVYCEDKDHELQRRQDAINAKYLVEHKELPHSFTLSRVGNNNLLITFDGKDKAVPTEFWRQLKAEIERMIAEGIKPGMLIVDTGADTFGGNENIRSQVRQYVQVALGWFAAAYNIAVIVLLHPSVAGTGSGTGGSTAWNASMRSRLHFFRDEINPDIRRLRVKKSNYAATGDEEGDLQLIWRNGCFVDIANGSDFVETIEAEANRVFIDLLGEITARGDHVSTSTRGNYAPRVMLQMARARGIQGFTVERLATSMEQLQHRGVITLVDGRRGRSNHLVIAAENAQNEPETGVEGST